MLSLEELYPEASTWNNVFSTRKKSFKNTFASTSVLIFFKYYRTILAQGRDDIEKEYYLLLYSVAEPESEPKLFETWSRNQSRNYFLNKYLLQSVWRMLG